MLDYTVEYTKRAVNDVICSPVYLHHSEMSYIKM
jgi:hypothetical protein